MTHKASNINALHTHRATFMHHRDGHINIVNATQFAAQMFGGLENLHTHTISATGVNTIVNIRAYAHNIRLSLQKCMGSRIIFSPNGLQKKQLLQ